MDSICLALQHSFDQNSMNAALLLFAATLSNGDPCTNGANDSDYYTSNIPATKATATVMAAAAGDGR